MERDESNIKDGVVILKGPSTKVELSEEAKDILRGSIYNKYCPSHEEASCEEEYDRKKIPVFSGVMKYFPDALMEVAKVSYTGNEQHNPGEELHWAREKGGNDLDALSRHLIDHAKGIKFDDDNCYHMAKVIWRGLATLQREIDNKNDNN